MLVGNDGTFLLRNYVSGGNVLNMSNSDNILIGTTTDNGNKLQVNGFVSMLPNSSASASYGVRFSNNNGTYWELRNVDAYNKFNFIYQGNVLADINSSSGVYAALSDVNKKKDFEQSQIGIDAVLGLKPTLYRFKDSEENSEKELGFIAQEVKDYIPQAYVEGKADDNKFIGLTQMPIIAALTKAIQEQQAQIEELKSEIQLLKNN